MCILCSSVYSTFHFRNSKLAQLFAHTSTHTHTRIYGTASMWYKKARKMFRTAKTISTSCEKNTSCTYTLARVITLWVTFENYLQAQAVKIWLYTCNERKHCIASFFYHHHHHHRRQRRRRRCRRCFHCHRRHHQYQKHYRRWLILLNFFTL